MLAVDNINQETICFGYVIYNLVGKAQLGKIKILYHYVLGKWLYLGSEACNKKTKDFFFSSTIKV